MMLSTISWHEYLKLMQAENALISFASLEDFSKEYYKVSRFQEGFR